MLPQSVQYFNSSFSRFAAPQRATPPGAFGAAISESKFTLFLHPSESVLVLLAHLYSPPSDLTEFARRHSL